MLNEFYNQMAEQKTVEAGSDMLKFFDFLSQEALKITMDLNNKYHSPAEIVEIFSKLTGKQVENTFRLYPPFYTDCGKNITVGKNVFINACCKFQDQGGIFIGDNCLIGHNVTITTLNHSIEPEKRQGLLPKSVKIGNNVWIGANVTILPGITIGDNAIIGAGSIVTKNVTANTIVAGNPAKILKHIESEDDND